MAWHGVAEGSVPLNGVGEFARGVITGSGNNLSLSIKIPPKEMARVEDMVTRANAMETVKRAMLQRSQGRFFETCGYGRDGSWRLVKAAPGLIRK